MPKKKAKKKAIKKGPIAAASKRKAKAIKAKAKPKKKAAIKRIKKI
jgi:hypothetical protein